MVYLNLFELQLSTLCEGAKSGGKSPGFTATHREYNFTPYRPGALWGLSDEVYVEESDNQFSVKFITFSSIVINTKIESSMIILMTYMLTTHYNYRAHLQSDNED